MRLLVLAGALSLSIALSGCGHTSSEVLELKQQGITRLEQGDYAGAAESFQSALDLSGKRIGAEETDLSYYKALALYKAGDAQGALSVYTSLMEQDEDNWEPAYLRGNLYLKEGRIKEAVSDYRQAVQKKGEDTSLYLNLYENLMNAGEQEEASRYQNALLSMDLSGGSDYYNAGYMYYLMKDYGQAETNLNTAKESGRDEALLMLGRIYSETDRKEDAEAAFASYREKHADDASALNDLAAALMSVKDYSGAVSDLEKALEIAEGDIRLAIRKNLIAACEYSGDFRKAYATARELVSKTNDEEIAREYEFLRTRISYENQSSTSNNP